MSSKREIICCRMRALLTLVLILLSRGTIGHPRPPSAVVDENGVAVPSARVTLQSPPSARGPLPDRLRRTLPVPRRSPSAPIRSSSRKKASTPSIELSVQITHGIHPRSRRSRTSRKSARRSTFTNPLPPSIPRRSHPRNRSADSTSSTSFILAPRLSQRHQFHSRRRTRSGRTASRRRRPNLPDRDAARWLQRDPARQRTTPRPRQHRRLPLHPGRAFTRAR